MTTTINRKPISAVIHTVANATIVVAGNSSVSNVAATGEVVNEGYIKQVWFGSPSGNAAYWVVKRGANTVLVLDSTAWLDFAGNGNMLKQDPTANLVVELVGSANGFISIELQKQSTFTSEY